MAKESFWSDAQLEPKRQYRFLMLIGGIPMWLIKKTSKPSFTVSETAHKYINHSFYYPGRVEWNTISVTLVDPVSPDASKTMENIIHNAGYNFPTDPNNTTTISKSKAVAALGRVTIQQIGVEEGEIVEEWNLINSWVKDVKFGELDYSSDEMLEITLEIRFDFAEMTIPGPGAGVRPADE